MKRIYEEGVSPVIATILMVAITVVLAATVWIMATNMAQLPQSEQPPKFVGDIGVSPNKTWVNFTVENNPVRKSKINEIKYVYIDNVKINVTSNLNDPTKNYSFWKDTNNDGFVSTGDILCIHLNSPLPTGRHTLKIVHIYGLAYSGDFNV